MFMIAAVIVTYNRKELLARNISMLLKQTKPFDKIFVVDNCSTDGTATYLQQHFLHNWNHVICYIKTPSNIGGAGGFHMGMEAAFNAGADWIVLMDDDGYMADEHTLQHLYSVANPLYCKNFANRKLFINALVQQDDLLSFKMGNKYTVSEAIQSAKDGILEGEANPFNGTMVSKELVAEIGYPNQSFFIKGDEVDYKQRTLDAHGYIATVVYARYIHPRPEVQEKIVLGKRVPFFVEAPWKEYYTARNFTYMYKRKKWYKAILFELIFIKLLSIFSFRCQKIYTIRMLFKGVFDGWNGKLGATVTP